MSEAVKAAQIREANNAYVSTPEGRKEWRRIQGEIRDSFAADLAAEFLSGAPKTVTDRIFSKAWEDGHSEGYAHVASHYEELADMFIFVKKEWGSDG